MKGLFAEMEAATRGFHPRTGDSGKLSSPLDLKGTGESAGTEAGESEAHQQEREVFLERRREGVREPIPQSPPAAAL